MYTSVHGIQLGISVYKRLKLCTQYIVWCVLRMAKRDSQIHFRIPKKEHKTYSKVVPNMSEDLRNHVKTAIGDNCGNKE